MASMPTSLVQPFQKMRRRLTVTGASETIDGVSRLKVSEENQDEKKKVRREYICLFRY